MNCICRYGMKVNEMTSKAGKEKIGYKIVRAKNDLFDGTVLADSVTPVKIISWENSIHRKGG